MALTVLTITPTYTRNGDTVDHSILGFGDPLGYTVAGSGTSLPTTLTCVVTFKSYAGDAIATQTITLTSSNGTTATGTGDITRFNSKLRTSHNCGNSTLSATCDGITATTEIEVVLLSAWGLKSQYFPGIPDQVRDVKLGTTITLIRDTQCWSVIEDGIRSFEERSRIYLRKRVVATPGYQDASYGSYDISEDALPYIYNKNIYFSVTLPFGYVIGTPQLKLMLGTGNIWEIPQEWRENSTDRRLGRIKNIPWSSVTGGNALFAPSVNLNAAILFPGNTNYMAGADRLIANCFHFRYTTGWDESHDPIPQHFISWVGREAACRIADLWWMGLTQGLGSRSLSMDGLSKSVSRNDPGFTQAKESWRRDQQDTWDQAIIPFIPIRVHAVR